MTIRVIKNSVQIRVNGRLLPGFGYSVSQHGIVTLNPVGRMLAWILKRMPGSDGVRVEWDGPDNG